MSLRLSKFCLANFCLCIALQFVWLGYAAAHGQPVHDKFLMFQSGRGAPAWSCVFIGPVLLAGYFVDRPDLNRFARMFAAVLGLGGVVWLLGVPYLLSNVSDDQPFIFKTETAVGIYLLLSQVALAAFWRPRD
jgi:hypothetical protein